MVNRGITQKKQAKTGPSGRAASLPFVSCPVLATSLQMAGTGAWEAEPRDAHTPSAFESRGCNVTITIPPGQMACCGLLKESCQPVSGEFENRETRFTLRKPTPTKANQRLLS